MDAPCYQPTGLTIDETGDLWIVSDVADFGHDKIYRLDPDTEASLENSLQYRIGRLEIELDIDFIKVGDVYDRLFKFQITRSFGDL